ncbi:MAG: hypothetical protein RML45_16160 [Acetobacteraceae bacterium]|nr:hypothetical protein [Acetobacteraceae bacterium]
MATIATASLIFRFDGIDRAHPLEARRVVLARQAGHQAVVGGDQHHHHEASDERGVKQIEKAEQGLAVAHAEQAIEVLLQLPEEAHGVEAERDREPDVENDQHPTAGEDQSIEQGDHACALRARSGSRRRRLEASPLPLPLQ